MKPAILPFPSPDPSDREPTVRDLVLLYLEHEGPLLKPKVLSQKKTRLEAFVSKFGNHTCDQLHPSDLKTWVRNAPAWKADDTKRAVMRCVQRVFNWAVDDDRLAKNPFRKADWPPGPSRRSMTEDEFRRLLRRATDAIFRRVLIFLGETGCRPSELADLTWDMVRWEESIAVIPHHKTEKKTGKPRVIYLTPVALALLRWLWRRAMAKALASGPLAAPTGTEKAIPANAHVFLNRRHHRWSSSNLDQRMERLRGWCGIPDDCKLYGLRHRYGNRSQAAGNDIRTTADLMGHASTRTTERFYLHSCERRESLLKAAAKAMGKDGDH